MASPVADPLGSHKPQCPFSGSLFTPLSALHDLPDFHDTTFSQLPPQFLLFSLPSLSFVPHYPTTAQFFLLHWML